MPGHLLLQRGLLICLVSFLLSSCASQMNQSGYTLSEDGLPLYHGQAPYSSSFDQDKYADALPQNINLGKEKVILIDPNKFAWGAYDEDGKLVRAGIASAGADYCEDIKRPCRTSAGSFRIYSLGDSECVSRQYPVGVGGSLMPYCMFFHKGQSLHGTPDQMMSEKHASHGCIRMRIPDAEWLRYNFAHVGTKVVVVPY